ncbi:RidA family protein [Aureimonas fodinaquatilis]|uniref:RidA family protein n=1 Tax=Aureimonas fodinaquatilis TaxID=2565783 RepID=A0A5B0E0E4_9HYPH|nr:RidA family protein [Aureimonas fodinaquatilis]KAA0971762.1 RidA family protein [Aureimonas fodinaquatilis]
MTKRLLIEGATKRLGAYAHAVTANGMVYVSGQGPAHPDTGAVPEAFEAQVHQVFANVKQILEGAQSDISEVVKLNVYLSDLSLFDAYNRIYEEYFGHVLPARTTIGCELPNIMVEVDCVAVIRLDP